MRGCIWAYKLGLAEIRRHKAPFGRRGQKSLPRVENHVEQPDNAVGDIVSALRVAANVSDHPCKFAFLGLVWSLYEISASRSFKLGETVSKVWFSPIGMVGLRIELRAPAQRGVEVGQHRFQLFPRTQRTPYRLVECAAGAITSLREWRRMPRISRHAETLVAVLYI